MSNIDIPIGYVRLPAGTRLQTTDIYQTAKRPDWQAPPSCKAGGKTPAGWLAARPAPPPGYVIVAKGEKLASEDKYLGDLTTGWQRVPDDCYGKTAHTAFSRQVPVARRATGEGGAPVTAPIPEGCRELIPGEVLRAADLLATTAEPLWNLLEDSLRGGIVAPPTVATDHACYCRPVCAGFPTLYVDPSGRDQKRASGTKTRPFLTPEYASRFLITKQQYGVIRQLADDRLVLALDPPEPTSLPDAFTLAATLPHPASPAAIAWFREASVSLPSGYRILGPDHPAPKTGLWYSRRLDGSWWWQPVPQGHSSRDRADLLSGQLTAAKTEATAEHKEKVETLAAAAKDLQLAIISILED